MVAKFNQELTPCIGFCSTTYGDDCCRGCYRSFEQVLKWRNLNLEDKFQFYQEIAIHAQNLLSDKVLIVDEDVFLKSCKECGVIPFEGISRYYFLLNLLQRGAFSFLTHHTAGLNKLTSLSWSELYRWVDREIFTLRLNAL
jgi:predicted Fe-S protein YdhL (DUF1289 family)